MLVCSVFFCTVLLKKIFFFAMTSRVFTGIQCLLILYGIFLIVAISFISSCLSISSLYGYVIINVSLFSTPFLAGLFFIVGKLYSFINLAPLAGSVHTYFLEFYLHYKMSENIFNKKKM